MSGIFQGIFKILMIWTLMVTSFASYAEEIVTESSLRPKPRPFIWFPFGYYTPETKAAVGALFRWNQEEARPGRVTHTSVIASYTQNKQVIFNIVPKRYLNQGRDELSTTLSYLYYPNRYYGTGELGYLEKPEYYNETRKVIQLSYSKNLWSYLFAKASGSFKDKEFSIKEGGADLQGALDQFKSRYQSQCLGAALEWDSRDLAEAPRQGHYHSLTRSNCQRWTKTELELKYYFSPASRSVVATQLLLGEMAGDQIPFSSLYSIGGKSILRGYYLGRYRDRSLGILQTEWRQDFREQWTWVIFAGVGKMGNKVDRLDANYTVASHGFGIHYYLDKVSGAKLRGELGWGTDRSFGLYFINGEAF